MRKIITAYGVLLAVLLVASVAGVKLSQASGTAGAIRKLGKGEREFREARQALLLGLGDPAEDLIAFVNRTDGKRRARIQALQILGDMSLQRPLVSEGDRISGLLRTEAPQMQAAVVEALGKFGGTGGIGDVAWLFKTTTDTALFRLCFQTMKEMVYPPDGRPRGMGVHSMGVYLQERMDAGDTAAIDSCAAVLGRLPVGKGRLFPLLALYHESRGEFAKAAQYIRDLGLVRRWWVIGGWDNQKMAGFHKPFPPETTAFDAGQSFPLTDSTRARWYPIRRVNTSGDPLAYGGVAIRKLMVNQLYSIAYLFTYLHCPEEREALLFLGSDDGARVWLNDSLVWSNKVYRGTFLDDDVVRVHLRKGVNRLLIKVAQDIGGWGCVARVTDFDGEGFDDVRAGLSDSLETDAAAVVIARMETGGNWRSKLDSLDPGDDGLADGLLSTATDEGATMAVRISALEAIRTINSRRMVPAGEKLLIAAAGKNIDVAAAESYVGEVLKTLVAMRTHRALELGLEARKHPAGPVRFYGELLIGLYCRHRIVRAGSFDHGEMPHEVRQAFADVESMRPRDPWVLERLAAFHREEDDSAAAARYTRRIGMPDRWLLNVHAKVDTTNPRGALSGVPLTTAGALDALWSEGREGLRGWRRGSARKSAPDLHGAVLRFTRELGWRKGKDCTVLCTQVEADRERDLRMAVTVGSRYWAFLNGRRVGETVTRRPSAFELREIYPPQVTGFDADYHPVRLRAGTNTIVLVVSNDWYQNVWSKFVRCSFVDGECRTMGFDGQRLLGTVEDSGKSS